MLKNKTVSLVFIICIFVTGLFTAIKYQPVLFDVLKNSDADKWSTLIEDTYPLSIAGRTDWINANGLYNKMLFRDYVEDKETDVYRMKNGQLIYGVDRLKDQEIEWCTEMLEDFDDELSGKNIPLLYVQLPYKIKENEELLPSGCTEYANYNADMLLKAISEKGLKSYDLRQEADEWGDNYSEHFYNTDQHWRNDTALWAASYIAEKLHELYGFDYEAEQYDLNNYTVKTYKDHFLGSFGKKTGVSYSGLDTYELITPNFATSYSFTATTEVGTINRSGDFKTALLDESNLVRDLYNTNTYETYIGGNYKLTKIVNRLNKEGSKILLIRDSFSLPMMSFLAASYGEIDSIDLRYYDDSAVELAESGGYDAVIIAYNPSTFGDEVFYFGSE